MEEVETIQAERESIESEFISPSQDMGKKTAVSGVIVFVSLVNRHF